MLEQRIEQDLKAALLSGNRDQATLLRGLKSALLYAKVAAGKRDEGLSDDEVIAVLSKEAKKRQESADLYAKGGDQSRASAELAEKKIIETYLPAQLSEDELKKIIDETVAQLGALDVNALGQVIGAVKAKTAGTADGAVIARLTKERLSQ
ncbi:MAG TPA: GatB/YqeY domain-containing protein [Candidatus Saccharimonadales bacterium]|nr:GatB/YqeY domain-containing protein [Candidatus Saccharimonadales bacterium]